MRAFYRMLVGAGLMHVNGRFQWSARDNGRCLPALDMIL